MGSTLMLSQPRCSRLVRDAVTKASDELDEVLVVARVACLLCLEGVLGDLSQSISVEHVIHRSRT